MNDFATMLRQVNQGIEIARLSELTKILLRRFQILECAVIGSSKQPLPAEVYEVFTDRDIAELAKYKIRVTP